ncbi:copper resistance CopC/CopD family protein [Williamsia sp. CHRR-6]|uniref:copper resistance CopC/CopD family protein n=1 Tax=Williamsia sp. CHRR-6 TaxID=2835871 RepID=UPI001BDB5F29|nr:copper resistance protein CopC [Williamsia sp. CHRR-6]MBT0567844.1 copper resistance protein CopC/CopD [Williamsia sp. CHRR-6]
MVAGAAVSPAPASAHATLSSSNPADGSRVETAPTEVRLVFDEAVRVGGGATAVISSTGGRADAGPARQIDGTTLVIPLRAGLPRAAYTATWRVVSADSHVVTGSISFGVGQDAVGAPGGAPADKASSLTLADDVAQGVLYAGVVGGVGVPLVAVALWGWALRRRVVRATVIVGGLAMLAATVVQFLMAGPRTLNVGWDQVLTRDSLRAGWEGDGGQLAWRLVFMVAATVGATLILRVGGQPRWPTVLTGAAGLAAAGVIAHDGHAGVGSDAWLATTVAAVHISAMTLWLGGLALLIAVVLRTEHTDGLRRWSLLGFGCVAVLILTGEYQSFRQITPVEGLWDTRYGVTLLIKLLLVATMLALAVAGRRGWRRRAAPTLDSGRLRRTVPIEAALGVAVLVATSFLVAEPPARTTFGPPFTTVAALDGSRSVRIQTDTTRRGPAQVTITARNRDGESLAVSSIAARLSSTDSDIASLPLRLREDPTTGSWRSTYAVIPEPGRWTVTVTVNFTEADAVVTSAAFRVW